MQKLSNDSAAYHQSAQDFLENVIRKTSLNQCFGSAGLAIGTTSLAAVKIVNTTAYTVGGMFYSKTTAEVPFLATVHDIAPNATSVQEQVYLLSLDNAGNPALTGGGITTGAGTALLPELPPATLTPIGYVRIAVAAGATGFTGATTLLSAAQLTVTYTNVNKIMPSFVTAQ